MADISNELDTIMKARYGKDVRQSIHDGIKKINDVVEETGYDKVLEKIVNLGNHCYYKYINNDFSGNYVVKITGEKVMSEKYRTSKPILLKKGDYLQVTARVYDKTQCLIYLCDENGDFINTMRNGDNNMLLTVNVGGYEKDNYFSYCGNIEDKIEAIVYTPIATKKELDDINIKVDSVIKPQIYHIGVEQQYKTFTECIRSLKDDKSEKIVYVHSGEYDIFSEIGGSEFAASISEDTDWRDCNDIIPDNTTIIGIGYVKFLFKPTPEEIGSIAMNLLSPINVVKNIVMKNIEIDAENCRYGIHDDGSSLYGDTKHVYENVRIKRTGKGYKSAFGAGIGNQSEFYFKNCIFKSTDRPLSFHNQSFSTNGIIVLDNTVLDSDGNVSIRLGSLTLATNKYPIIFNAFNCYINKKVLFIREGGISDRSNAFLATITKCGEVDVDYTEYGEEMAFKPSVYK